MANAADIVAEIIDSRELRLRASFRSLLGQMQREFEPPDILRDAESVPSDLIEEWQSRYQRWYMSKDDLWRQVFGKAIDRMDVMIPQKSIPRPRLRKSRELNNAYINFINGRSEELSTMLANTDGAAVRETLKQHSGTSWTRMKRELRRNIGLQPRQIAAQARYEAWARANLSKEKAERAIERAYKRRLNYRAGLIAKTEMGNAISDAQLSTALARRESGEYPKSMVKVWRTRGFRVCPVCITNEDTEAEMEKPFPTGHIRPLAHPDCRCGLQFVSEPGRRPGRERYDQRESPIVGPPPYTGETENTPLDEEAWTDNLRRQDAKAALIETSSRSMRPHLEQVLNDYPTPTLEEIRRKVDRIQYSNLRSSLSAVYNPRRRIIQVSKRGNVPASSLRHEFAHALDDHNQYSPRFRRPRPSAPVPDAGGKSKYRLRLTLDDAWNKQQKALPEGCDWKELTTAQMRRAFGRPGIRNYAYKNSTEYFAEAMIFYREYPRKLKVYYPELYQTLRDAVFRGKEF